MVSHNAVTAAGSVTVGGRPYATWTIGSRSVTGGAHPGTERDVSWHSGALGLDLRFTIDRSIQGTFPYRLVLDTRLVDTTPSR